MAHEEYIRHVEGSRFAVLMIHGIVGTPDHFLPLLPCIPQDWSVYNILLDGHGKTVADFGASSMSKWKVQVNDWLTKILDRHEKVLIVAHSMGTLFAIQAAVDHPEQIGGLFLLAVPLRLWVRFSTMLTCLRLTGPKLSPEDKAAHAMKAATGTVIERNLFKYIPWAPRFWELLVEIRRVRGILPLLKVPAQSFQSQVDELVSVSSCKLLEEHPYINNTVLSGSGHFRYGEEDLHLLRSRLEETVKKLQ